MTDESVPIAEDVQFAKQYLVHDNGECSCEKTSYEVARQRRLQREDRVHQDAMHTCLKGDENTGYIGMQAMVTEIYEKHTGKSATTEITKKGGGWDEIKKYVYIGVGIIGTLSLILPLIWDKLFPPEIP